MVLGGMLRTACRGCLGLRIGMVNTACHLYAWDAHKSHHAVAHVTNRSAILQSHLMSNNPSRMNAFQTATPLSVLHILPFATEAHYTNSI